MNQQDISNLINALDPYLDKKMKESLFVGMQYGKKETSNLVFPLKEIMEERFSEANNHLIEIKQQVMKTNGRVNSLELSRSYLWGAVAVLLILGGGIVSMFWVVLEQRINHAVEQALLDNATIYETRQ